MLPLVLSADINWCARYCGGTTTDIRERKGASFGGLNAYLAAPLSASRTLARARRYSAAQCGAPGLVHRSTRQLLLAKAVQLVDTDTQARPRHAAPSTRRRSLVAGGVNPEPRARGRPEQLAAAPATYGLTFCRSWRSIARDSRATCSCKSEDEALAPRAIPPSGSAPRPYACVRHWGHA